MLLKNVPLVQEIHAEGEKKRKEKKREEKQKKYRKVDLVSVKYLYLYV